MADVVKPASLAELAEMHRRSADTPFEIIGSGTKRGLGRPVQAARTLDMSGFSDVIIYEPEELILETGAGTRLADIEALIAAKGQQLAFEPPDYSRVLGSAHSGSIGGLIACNLSGPRRIKAGAARDHILGIHGVTGMGDMFKAGGRVVKNVTGYDLPKLRDRFLWHAGRLERHHPQGSAASLETEETIVARRATRRHAGGRPAHEHRHAIIL